VLLSVPLLRLQAQTACLTCHPAQAKPQPATSMAHALEMVSECGILKEHPILTFQNVRYTYRIERKGNESVYSVSDGQTTFTVQLRWAFGLGFAGQTYVYEKNGELYQSRVSYYQDITGLDFTLGALNDKLPSSVEAAAGLPLAHEEKIQCFRCHSTGSVDGSPHSLAELTPGIQCERCHGPTAEHVASFKLMRRLSSLTSEQTANFCGQCHRTWDQVAGAGIRGVVNVRFQPYRLTNSKCYDPDDARIRCTSCHDPHQDLNRVDASYDNRCQACHAARGKPHARVCKIAAHDCVSCHMPKVEIPGSHHKFTDHDIRIAKANAPYPD
jgi:hypothetical protein